MSRKTPHIQDGFLLDADGNPVIEVGSAQWFTWLKDETHQTFHFVHSTGGFTARKELKQRGDCYWVAYRQFKNKLHKTYLGKSVCLTADHLDSASAALTAIITDFHEQTSE